MENIIVMIDGVPFKLVPLVERPDSQTPIESCGLPTRAVNALRNGNIEYLEQVFEKTEMDLIRLPDFGRKYLNEVRCLLTQRWPHLRIGQFKRE